ncbi:MAG TPA: phosphoglucosamine mutase [Marinilabiliales bacterium]|nr:MAG: phosphoglucosamine mutase [Bacteroidetes bacterium GWD2_40_43]OFX93262.1 MAG: phosphoglucosamine mutase [Bacteroidetes bacterium GWE2_40_63]OFY17676.1 MAG: phosphoglucosamine mutase [Bacteroidetes bacterium GWF2_40_13]OFZ23464.1 MAG: phosphoglucosamine mutase [Bacteroidetes bacterium RIFOXYC2_FULL_40_12]HAM97961.1 phosphoglucosamine mutase [Marinilabiliales bacterium]
MTLIKSISGIRGTIGGRPGEGLSPLDVVKYTAAYGAWAKENAQGKEKIKIVVGRDARISGPMVSQLVIATLVGSGIDVVHLGLATTPTTEMAVTDYKADGGLILTASHNPKQWNALKLLDSNGEFLNGVEGEKVLALAENGQFTFAQVDQLGKVTEITDYDDAHIQHILKLKWVDVDAIRKANLKVVFDGINSVGGIILPKLFKALGVEQVVALNAEATGNFAHTPEPLPENLTQISRAMVQHKAHVGFVVDPDVDRLAIVNEDGTMFGEEYTLVAIADYLLSKTPGNTVSNLSSTRALRDVTEKHGGTYSAAAVGEVNVVTQMKNVHAVIGGEGNGGIIYPELHYGRDALVGIALFLTQLAMSGKTCKQLRATYPEYFISKNKIELTPDIDVDAVLVQMKQKYTHEKVNDIDGVKIDFATEWVHLRKSNTEPIIRIYAESKTEEKAAQLAEKIIGEIKEVAKI